MREVLGAGRGVQAGEVETPAMVAEARKARRGAKSDEEGDGGDGVAQDILSRKALSFVPRKLYHNPLELYRRKVLM